MGKGGAWGAGVAAWALLLVLAFQVDRWTYLHVAGSVAEKTGEKAWRFDRPEGGHAAKLVEILTLFKRMGEVWFVMVISVTMVLIAPARCRQVLVLWLAIGAAALVGQVLLKHAVGKLRPDAELTSAEAAKAGDAVVRHGMVLNQGAALLRPFSWEHSGLTFPSGHAALAFAAFAVLGRAFPRARWWFLFLACGVAASRVLMGEHFLSDVIAGAGVGYVCARAVLAVPRLHRLMTVMT